MGGPGTGHAPIKRSDRRSVVGARAWRRRWFSHWRARTRQQCARTGCCKLGDAITREWSPDPKRCSVKVKGHHLHTSVTFEQPCVPPKTHRIWNGRRAPDRLPMSFWRYAWPFKSYRGGTMMPFHFHAAPFGIRTPWGMHVAMLDSHRV